MKERIGVEVGLFDMEVDYDGILWALQCVF